MEKDAVSLTKRPIRLFTFGHGTATPDELVRLIRDAGLQTVVDGRSVPKSRRHPWVWRQEMERWIPNLTGSAYRFCSGVCGSAEQWSVQCFACNRF